MLRKFNEKTRFTWDSFILRVFTVGRERVFLFLYYYFKENKFTCNVAFSFLLINEHTLVLCYQLKNLKIYKCLIVKILKSIYNSENIKSFL